MSGKSSFDDRFLESPGGIVAIVARLAGRRSNRRRVPIGVLQAYLNQRSSALVQTHVAATGRNGLQGSTALAMRIIITEKSLTNRIQPGEGPGRSSLAGGC
jgi:hypothetical protein